MPHVQIRNVPPKLHQLLKLRAADAGMSLNEFLLRELRRIAETPTVAQVVARAEARGFVEFPESSAEILRAERDAH
jgi:antitoxin FitA